MKNPSQLLSVPKYSEFTQAMMKQEGENRRASIQALSPIAEVQELMAEIRDNFAMWCEERLILSAFLN